MALEDTINLYNLKDKDAASVIAYIPDLHVATDALREVANALQERTQDKDAYIVLSDIDEKKDRLELAKQMGLPSKEDIIFSSVAQDLSEEEKETFQYLFVMDMQGGIENYVKLVEAQMPGTDVQKEVDRYNQTFEKYRQTGLEDKIQNILEGKQEQLQQDVLQIKIASMAFDRAVSQYNLGKVAKEIKEINDENKKLGRGKLKVIAGSGNHDNEYDINYLQSQLGEDIVYNSHKLKGAIELGDDNDEISFQIASNCYGISQHFDSQAYLPEEEASLYPHMRLEENLFQDIKPEDLENITEKDSLNSFEYQRMFAGEEKDRNLDFLLLHEEIGSKVGYENSPYSNVDSVGVLYTIANKLEEGENQLARVYSGHLHKEITQEVEELGITKYRNYATIIDKNGEEVLNVSNKHPKLDYDLNQIKNLFEREYQVLIKQYSNIQSSEKSRAA